jgi:hypothetical protein
MWSHNGNRIDDHLDGSKNCHVMLILMISPYHLTQKGLGQKRRFLMVFHQSHKNSDMEPGE